MPGSRFQEEHGHRGTDGAATVCRAAAGPGLIFHQIQLMVRAVMAQHYARQTMPAWGKYSEPLADADHHQRQGKEDTHDIDGHISLVALGQSGQGFGHDHR